MENITIGQIVGAIGVISVIASFVGGIIVAVSKWWKSRVTDKFAAVNNKFVEVDNEIKDVKERRDDVEEKRVLYEKELENSKLERMILLEGELAALKGLNGIKPNELITKSIDRIEKYMLAKSHDLE